MAFPKRGIIIAAIAAVTVGGGSAVAADEFNVFDQGDDTRIDGGRRFQQDATVSIELAIETARTERDGRVEDVELDREAGRLVYDIEIDDTSVYVDAMTGEIVPATELVERDDDDDRELWDDDEPVTGDAGITPEQAAEIARGEVDGPVGDIELDSAQGRLVYDVEINDTDVIIDANTGEVLGIDTDD